jgi:hypothetical protein
MSNEAKFTVQLRDLIVDAEQLTELIAFLNSKQFLDKDYKGRGQGFAGSEYDYKLVDCDANGRVEIKPIPEKVWLYLNTFGKETK